MQNIIIFRALVRIGEIMRFIVKNFGPIKHADVTLGDFTVFVGPGGTGKSYLAYLIWMLQEMEPDWGILADKIYPLHEFLDVCFTISGEYKRLGFDETVKFDEDFTHRLLTKVMEIAQEAYEKTISQYLKDTFRVGDVGELIRDGANFCEIKICNNGLSKCIDIRLDKSIRIRGFDKLIDKGDYIIDFIKSKNKLVLKYKDTEVYEKYIPPNLDIGEISGIVYDLVTMAVPHIMVTYLDGFCTSKASFILTDSKSGFLRFAPSLIRYALLEARRKGEFPLGFSDIYMLSKLIIDRREIKNEKIGKIADFLEEAIGGEVYVETDGLVFPEIFFKKGDLTIPILRSHSGVRELAPLIIYLRYVIEMEGAFIVIEEPETHLHPYMQSIVTRALAMLSEYADVLITTHSPIILDELDNLIKLNKLSPEEKKKLGYREDEGLDPESLKIYRFKLDGTVEEIGVTEDGIEEEEFSSVIAELSNKYADVEEAVWRKLHGNR